MSVKDNLKNIVGWKTDRKIVVFSIDDYGNVRVNSKASRNKMDQQGMKVFSRFDAYDALETRADLEALYETLSSVRDKNGHHAVFTPFAMPCNIDFETIITGDYQQYHYELLPVTYQKLTEQQPNAYSGTWDLWKQGISSGLMVPQFHGREHFSLKVFEEKLRNRDTELLTALSNRSFTSLSSSGYSTIVYTAAFEFWDLKENDRFEFIIRDGLNAFEKVYGYRSVHFNPPGGREHPVIHSFLKANGIRYSDTPFIKKEHQGHGKYKTVINYTGKRNHLDMVYEVRNAVFEPTFEKGIDWVNYTLQQVETAFRWHRPAIISSHRVNFCGHIDENNRNAGIGSLKKLLRLIMQKWPEVEFMSADKLGALMENKHP